MTKQCKFRVCLKQQQVKRQMIPSNWWSIIQIQNLHPATAAAAAEVKIARYRLCFIVRINVAVHNPRFANICLQVYVNVFVRTYRASAELFACEWILKSRDQFSSSFSSEVSSTDSTFFRNTPGNKFYRRKIQFY